MGAALRALRAPHPTEHCAIALDCSIPVDTSQNMVCGKGSTSSPPVFSDSDFGCGLQGTAYNYSTSFLW
jgi:hypothetical protein